jgi:hypothetical protein
MLPRDRRRLDPCEKLVSEICGFRFETVPSPDALTAQIATARVPLTPSLIFVMKIISVGRLFAGARRRLPK